MKTTRRTGVAVIFDCDGVMVDTEGAANRVLAELRSAESFDDMALLPGVLRATVHAHGHE